MYRSCSQSHRVVFHRIVALIFILSQLAVAFPPTYASASPFPLSHSQFNTHNPPFSIARIQSTYTAGDTVVTFTLTNNLPATRVPEISASATATETVDLLADFIVTDDVNTLRGITLADTLAAGTTLLAASGDPVQTGTTLTWTLPDLPPQASATITLSLQTPSQTTDFVALDSGAQANAEVWGDPVTVTASPAVLIPTGLDPALTLPTVDANSHDADMLWKSAELGQDALAMFAYVQSLGFEAYEGSLRGTRGTLWGESGNAPDQSSLLIAMLRAAGVPARYRHGTLDTADAQMLIGSMFPARTGIAGNLPAGTSVSDPLNDLELLALVADHWWVEAYLPGSGWTNLDPSFPEAQPRDIFATPGANDRIAELPANTRQHVTFELEVEQYNSFPIGGVYLSTSTPLVATFSVSELASKAVTFGHMVHTEVQGGVYSNVIHNYTPYFAVGGDDFLYFGDEFQDLLTTFPLATHFTTAEWLHVTVTAPNGQVTDSFTRELKDLIGLDIRQNGGSPTITLPEDNAPFATGSDLFASWFLPNEVNNLQYAERAQTENMRDVIATAIATDNLPEDLNTPEGSAAFSEMFLQYVQARNEQYALAGLEFAKLADPANRDIENNLGVNMVYEKPRIIIASSQEHDDTVLTAMDLRSTEARIHVGPGQAQAAAFTAQWMKAVRESYFEGDAIYRLTGEFPLTISRIFDEMGGQGIAPIWLTPSDVNLLSLYFPDSASTAYAKQALIEGKSILIPSAPVTIDGEPVLGWWEVDPQTGMVDSVSEDGLHLSLVEYEMISVLVDFAFLLKDAGEIQESVKKLWTCTVQAAVPALQGNPGGPVNCLDGWSPPGPAPQTLSWRYLPAYLCPVDNCGLEQFTQNYPDSSSIPLPDMTMRYFNRVEAESWAARTLEVSDNGGGGGPTLALSASPASGAVLPGETFNFDLSASANFDGLVDAWVYAPDGWGAGFDATTLEGQITPKPGALPGNYPLTIVGQARDFPNVLDVLELTVTVPDAGALSLAWETEPNLTIPTGAALFGAVSNETNDGETEVPNAAFRLDVANLSGQSKALTLSVSGAPAEWIILNGARQTTANFTLAPNERAQVGLYVSPPTLPAPGTVFNMDVQLSDGQTTENVTIPWGMPSQAFNYIAVAPNTIYLGADSSTDFTIEMTNVSNESGTFPISALLPPVTASINNLPTSVTLALGETQAFNATLNTTGLPLGARFPIILGSPAPGSYTQYAVLNAQIISPLTEPVFVASENAANVCTLGEPGLSAALDSLALAMVHLEASCLNGDCNLSLRDQAVNAAYSVAIYAGGISTGVVEDDALIAVAGELATHTENADILADLQNLSDGIVALDTEVCAWSASMPVLKWTPHYGAALVSQPTTYTLNLTNSGTLTTTYALTVTLPSGAQTFTPEINPGETSAYTFPASSPTISLLDLSATATVVGQDSILANSNAVLNVVDKFVQLTAVTPDPAFVETGVSATDISIAVANIANILQPATAQLEILHPSGAVQFAADYPVSILVGSPRSYALGTVDTSGWETGVYTVSVVLRDGDQQPISDGSGYAYLGVGQTVGISHAVEPVIVAPGAVTVTTVITTEILTPAIITETIGAGNQEEGNRNLDELIPNSQFLIPNSISSTSPITRTEDTAPTIVYTGTWTVVNNVFAIKSSNNDYTWADAAGETAMLAFSGTWVHIGFQTDVGAGQAEIFVDGESQGVIDTFTKEEGERSFVFDGFTDTSHTLEIVVLGIHHPNATGNQVRLDFIDTWDGTLFADGITEENSPRVWRSGDWVDVAEGAASGGSYMRDGLFNNGTAWFPFTGDSITFVGLANTGGFRASVYIDGVWQQNAWLYNGQPVTRTLTFDGLGAGPHVMQINNYYGEPNVDAFITPAIEPGYTPPPVSGITRYEEDHPAMLYNGYPYELRKNTWARNAATYPSSSDVGNVSSQTLSDTIRLTFEGVWVSVGFLGRSTAGLAEIFIDGTSYGTVNTYDPVVGQPLSFQFGGLITGTHTIDIVVLDELVPPSAGTVVFLDYIDVWDGTPLADAYVDAHKGTESSRVHFNKTGGDVLSANAIGGDFFASGLPNNAAGVWYSFTGPAVTVYGFTRNNTTSMDVYIDDVFIETVSFHYRFSEQPFAVHYTGLSDGPHTLRVHNAASMRLDGFASNQPSLPYQPFVEWYDNSPAGNGAPIFGTVGIASGMAAGDVNGDGDVEIVVTADDTVHFGSMFVYRGDGADTGDGDPILWEHDFGGGAFRTWVGSPALADLDGMPGSEIVVASGSQLYAFHGDGTTFWITDTLDSIFETLTSPAIGNLDLDPEPEIVVNAGKYLQVHGHDGQLLWSTPFPVDINPPVLADLTGDGLLDIVVTGWDNQVYVYDFNYGSPQLVWSVTLPTSAAGTFGAPAVGDIDGQQPGGDPGPEVAVSTNGLLTVLNGEDGALVWDTPLDPGNPGGVSIADLDGDGEIEIVTGMRYEFEPGRFGMIYALNADGSILWNAIAEDSSSANNASVLDLDGDGIYEVAWNGAEQGFTIFNGLDGSVIFNEPLVYSVTGTDYPIIADVDNDGNAEVVSAALGGIRVFGYGFAWGQARPLWNQHSYHITNINDDLTVPFSEPNSWEVHNTYRTQTPALNPLPSYTVALTHTVGLDNVTVLTNTFNIPPTTSNAPTYGWAYAVNWENTVITQTFTSLLTDLQPGESRMVAQGTTADYVAPGGMNHLELPPLFVSVAHLLEVQPVTQTVGAGASAVFEVVLTNPAGVSTMFNLTVNGLPAGWATLSGAVPVPAGSSVTVPLTVDVPVNADLAAYPFLINATTDLGWADQGGGMLNVANLLDLNITPANQTITTGEVTTYTLSLTNSDTVARTYSLSGSGLAPLTLPAQVTVPANSTANVAFSAQAVSEGANPFTVLAQDENGTAGGQATATVTGEGFQQVEVAILPAAAPTGPGVLTPFDVRLTNLGTVPDTYDLTSSAPAGWDASLTLFGNPINTVDVAPGTSNAVTLQLFLTPADDAVPGDYDFSVTAQSFVSGTGAGVAQVGERGVSVSLSGPAQVSGSGVWEVTVTNNGIAADTYNLTVFGPFAQFAQLSATSVTLASGESQAVQLTASGFDFFLATDYLLGVHAQSQAQGYVQDEDVQTVAVLPVEGVVVAWQPASQTVTGATQAAFTVVVSNTGNVQTTFTLTGSGSSGASVALPVGFVTIPPHSTATLLVVAHAPGNGTYSLTLSADSGGAQGSGTATLVVEGVMPPAVEIYLPIVVRP